DRKQAVARAIVEENPGEAGADQRPDAVLHETPDRVLAAGAAAEIGPDHQKGGVAPAGLVEHEIRALAAIALEAQIVKQAAVEPAAIDAFQELLWHDHVGVDVGGRHRCRGPTYADEGLHAIPPPRTCGCRRGGRPRRRPRPS